MQFDNQLLGLLAAHPEGLSARELRDLLEPAPSQPTLSRRLMALLARGEVARDGKGPATRYMLSGGRHRLAELKSKALHEAVARKLVRDPALVEIARRNLETLRESNPAGRRYHQQWEGLLQGDRFILLRTMTSDSESARNLRQESPFGGILSPVERRRVLERFTTA